MASIQDIFDQYLEPSVTLQPGERVLTVGGKRGAYDPAQAEDYIRQRASALGIDPETAVRVAKSEGLRTYTGDSGSSFGPYQLHYGGIASGGNAVGGLGDEFTKATGLHARDPSTWQQQVDFALSHAAKNGWGAFHGAANSGIGEFAGIGGNAPAAAQASYQPSQQPEFGSAKTTGDLFDRLGTIIQGTASAPDIKPYEMKPAVPASVTALPQTPGAVEAARLVDWGAARNFLSGMAFGTGPIAAGAGRAVRGAAADIEGGKGVLSALTNAPAYFSAGRDLASQARDEYARDNPGWATGTDLAGGLVPAATGVGALTTGGRIIGGQLARMAPSLAPGIAETGALLSGQAGGMQSIPAMATRGGSLAATGALQGAAAGAAQTGITGGSVGDNTQQGAAFGGAVGVPLGIAGNVLMAPTRAAVTPGMRSLQGELSSTGTQLPGALMTEDRGVNMLSRAMHSPVVTPELREAVRVATETQYKRLEAVAGTPLDNTFRAEMQQLRGEIAARRSLGEKGDKLQTIIKDANSPNGNMSGADVVGFTRASGRLNEMQHDADMNPFASRIQNAIWANLKRNNPQAEQVLRDLRSQVAAWGDASSRVTKGPSQTAQIGHAAGVGAFTGELAGNLLAGEFSPVAVMRDMLHGNPVTLGTALGTAATAYGARKAAGAYANSPAFGRLLMGGGIGPQPNVGIPPAVQLYNEEQARRRAR